MFGRRGMKLKSSLFALTLVVLLPMVVFSSIVVALLIQHDQNVYRQGANDRVRALMSAVDSELEIDLTTLQALSAVLRKLDPSTWSGTLQEVLASQPEWIALNARRADGSLAAFAHRLPGAGPAVVSMEEGFARAMREGLPVFGPIGQGPSGYRYAVRLPVVESGEVSHVITALVDPARMLRLLRRQAIAAGTVGVVLDGENRFVARTIDPEKWLGQPASESLRAALARASEGWFSGRTVEGLEVYTPYLRSPETGWAVAMGLPASSVEAAGWKYVLLLGAGLAAAIVFALLLARLYGRRISQPLLAVAEAADDLAAGRRPAALPESAIDEVASVARGLAVAAQAVEDRGDAVAREQATLREADRAKDVFLASLSHELRNPLAAITTASHLLKTGGADAETRLQAQEVIDRQATLMTRLVEDLLETSRVAAGKTSLSLQTVDLSEVARDVYVTWRSGGRFDDHPVEFSSAPAWVKADPARMEQILSNLLDNALKFTPPGKPVRIRVWQEAGHAFVRVADGGKGVPAELLASLFEPFVQGATKRGGLGLGLALVKQLVALHGGTVACSSPGPDHGATFLITLPAVEAVQPALWPARSAAESRRLRVLVVEDNEDARRMLSAKLDLEGHHVSEAADGPGAVAVATAVRPDAAIIDIGLPGFDGYELARRLRAASAPGRIRLIALTGHGQPEDRERALAAGFDAHLVKPATADQVGRALAG
jgi:signal transduction histidine kinase